jgi:hypothetical protein
METPTNPPPKKRSTNTAFLIAVVGLLVFGAGVDLLVRHEGGNWGWILTVGGAVVLGIAIWCGSGEKSQAR